MKKFLLLLVLCISGNSGTYSQISNYPYVETGEFPVGWNVIQTIPIWNFGTALVNPAGKPNDAAVVCNFFAYASGPVGIVTSPLFNFNSLSNPLVNFYSAYTSYDLQNDSLQFLVSTDGGVTFIDVPVPFRRSFNSSPSLATVPTQHTQFIPSAVNHWRHETINMSAYAGRNNVMFGLRGVCDYGNNLWIDNFIVNDADSIQQFNVNAAGTYSFGIADVTFNTIGVGNNKLQPDNPGGGVLTFAEYRNQNPVPSIANPKIGINTTAVTGDGSVFTPNKISPDKWFTISYSGNDIRGYSSYNFSIDISSVTGIYNMDKIYIVKRADLTGSWICINTSRIGTRLYSNNLTAFSDFALASDSIINPLPVELTSFFCEVSGRNVILHWQTAWELNNSGFEIERKGINLVWEKIGFTEGKGNSNIPEIYTFRDENLNHGKYNYRLKQMDYNGNYEYHELSNDVNIENIQSHFLSQNYPNPFNPVTYVNFGIAGSGFIVLKIYNTQGKEIAAFVNENKEQGRYEVKIDANSISGGLPSGVYYYSLNINGNLTDVKRMILIK